MSASLLRLLDDARDLVAEGWCQGVAAIDTQGVPYPHALAVAHSSADGRVVASRCLQTALYAAELGARRGADARTAGEIGVAHRRAIELLDALARARGAVGGYVAYNDLATTTLGDVFDLVDEARSAAEQDD